MTRARQHIVCLEETPYYHVTARCVRRAFLCGVDHYSGRSYEHRRDWIEQRILVLTSIFSIDVAAYAVMSNHYHIVLRLAPDEAKGWSDEEVLRRWCSLFKGPLLVRSYLAGETLAPAEAHTVADMAAIYRQRLKSLSWFMKCLNEPIARKANAEDRCTGHFWEARFHSEALKTDEAVIQAMAYVDLNPIQAGIAKTPEASNYTSFRLRAQAGSGSDPVRQGIHALFERGELQRRDIAEKPLMPFDAPQSRKTGDRLPITKQDYFMLVDATARCIVPGKRGSMRPDLPPILERLGLPTADWIESMTSPRNAKRRPKDVAKKA